MGNGIAQTFAAAGCPVILRDISQKALDHGVAAIRKSLDRLVSREKLKVADADAAFGRVTPTTELEPLGACDLVVWRNSRSRRR
jgi:3-hydroxybutyryl-CoA dehydrogenase